MWISRRALGVTRDNLLIESCAGKWTRGSRLFENVQQEARQRPGGRVGISVRCVLARRHRSHCAHGPFYKLICQLYHTAADFSSFFAHRKEISLALTGSAENNKLFSGGRHLIECCRKKTFHLLVINELFHANQGTCHCPTHRFRFNPISFFFKKKIIYSTRFCFVENWKS